MRLGGAGRNLAQAFDTGRASVARDKYETSGFMSFDSRAQQALLPDAHGPGSHDDDDNTGQPTVVSDFTALLLPLSGDYFRWNYDRQGPAIGTTFVTFSFSEADALPDPSFLPYSVDSVFSFDETQRDRVRAAFERYSEVTGIIFVEIEEDGMIDFVGISGSTVGGYGYYPNPNRGNAGGVAVDSSAGTDWSQGNYGWLVLLHEIGHALGLKHPFEGDVILDTSLDTQSNTVMSYTYGGATDYDLRALDIEALQFLYGPAVNLTVSGLTYEWDETADILSIRGGALGDAISGVAQTNHIDGGAGDDHILGGAGEDILNGGLGNDILVTGFGNSVAHGDEGNDVLRSNGSQSQLFGDAGDDRFEVYGGTSLIDGGEGFDTIALLSFFAGEAENGFGAFFNMASSNVVSIEQVLGSGSGDTIIGSDQAETIRAGRGNDVVYGSGGADILDGGDGVDTLYYTQSTSAVFVDLAAGVASGGDAEGDTITGFENLVGSSYSDTLIGNDDSNTFIYLGGADTIDGRGGIDTLSLEFYANDLRINAASGLVEFRFDEAGQYFSFGLAAVTSIEGFVTGSGNDVLIGSDLNDVFNGGAGNNTLMGGAGDDRALYNWDLSQVIVVRLASGDVFAGRPNGAGYDHNISIETLEFSDTAIDAGSVALFRTINYVASHADLILTIGLDANAAAAHYVEIGYFEGRATDSFDALRYTASYADLIRAFGMNDEAATEHFVASGFAEGRNAAGFQPLDYIASYGDLIRAFGVNTEAATAHYVSSGFNEGRDNDNFNALHYTASHTDLIRAFGLDEGAATLHFIQSGFYEGRSADTFEAIDYLASNGDLLRAFGANTEAAIAHFVEYGFFEGRGTDAFDTLRYIASYGDLIQAFGVNDRVATDHYVLTGFSEGRNPLLFDAGQYLANYADLRAAFGGDLVSATLHFVQTGFFEGRVFAQLAETELTQDKFNIAEPGLAVRGVSEPGLLGGADDSGSYRAETFSFSGLSNSSNGPETPHYWQIAASFEFGRPGFSLPDEILRFEFNDLLDTGARDLPIWDLA